MSKPLPCGRQTPSLSAAGAAVDGGIELKTHTLESGHIRHVWEGFLGAEAEHTDLVRVLNQVVAVGPQRFYMPAQKGRYALGCAFARYIGHLNSGHFAELQMGDVVARPGTGTAAHHRVRVLFGVFDEVVDSLEGAVF